MTFCWCTDLTDLIGQQEWFLFADDLQAECLCQNRFMRSPLCHVSSDGLTLLSEECLSLMPLDTQADCGLSAPDTLLIVLRHVVQAIQSSVQPLYSKTTYRQTHRHKGALQASAYRAGTCLNAVGNAFLTLPWLAKALGALTASHMASRAASSCCIPFSWGPRPRPLPEVLEALAWTTSRIC